MKIIFLILVLFLLQNCNKSKTVLICGDHVCINKAEAKQFFEENLSIEVKILNKKNQNDFDLVELNLNNKPNDNKQINLSRMNKTKQNVKILTNDEIKIIKDEIKEMKKSIKTVKRNTKKSLKRKNKKNSDDLIKIDASSKPNVNVNKRRKEVVDVCTIIEKCNIDGIAKYLLKEGKGKDFPDITSK